MSKAADQESAEEISFVQLSQMGVLLEGASLEMR